MQKIKKIALSCRPLQPAMHSKLIAKPDSSSFKPASEACWRHRGPAQCNKTHLPLSIRISRVVETQALDTHAAERASSFEVISSKYVLHVQSNRSTPGHFLHVVHPRELTSCQHKCGDLPASCHWAYGESFLVAGLQGDPCPHPPSLSLSNAILILAPSPSPLPSPTLSFAVSSDSTVFQNTM